jgi:hypothetical protein
MCNREGAIAHNDADIGKDQGGYYDVSKLVATVAAAGSACRSLSAVG